MKMPSRRNCSAMRSLSCDHEIAMVYTFCFGGVEPFFGRPRGLFAILVSVVMETVTEWKRQVFSRSSSAAVSASGLQQYSFFFKLRLSFSSAFCSLATAR